MKKRFVLVMDGGCISPLNIPKRLECLGYEVIPIDDCSDRALAAAAEKRPDLLLLDLLRHAEGEGLAIAERVTSKLNIPIMMITGLASESQLNQKGANQETPQQKETKQKGAKQNEAASLLPFLLMPLNDFELGAAIERAVYRHQIEARKNRVSEDVPALGKTLRAAEVLPKMRKDDDAAFEFMRQINPFSQLPETALTELVNRSHFSSAGQGEVITFEGQHNDASFIVFSGRLAMTKTSVSGKDLIVQLLGPRDFFGLILAMEELPEQLSARAQSESEVLWIPTSVLLRVLDHHPDLYKAFIEQLSTSMHSSHDLSHGLAHDTAQVRIAALLLHLAAKFPRAAQFPKPVRESETAIVIDIMREQIADLTGATPGTASRVTREMHRHGILDMNTPGVIRVLNLQELKKLVAEQ